MKPIFAKFTRGLLLLLLLLGVTGTGVATRRHVLDAQRQLTSDGSIPFTLESALAFRRIQLVYRDGELPRVDRGIQVPDGVVTRELDTLGVERAYSQISKLWPGTLNLAEKIRWLHLLWFCLTIPALFFWVKWMGGGGVGGFWASAFYAVAISAVARSTGQELSHENNALPLLVAHLALAAWARNEASSFRAKMLAGWASALLAGLALCAWDMVQFYLLLLFGWEWATAIRGRITKQDLWSRTIPLMAVLLAAAFRNPYLRAHAFWISPTLALGWGALLAGSPIAQRQSIVTRCVLGLLPILACLILSPFFMSSYGHFGSLLWAKLKFFNIRPDNPALLSFEQRILWVPALNSTSWPLMWDWFPVLLVLTGISILALLWGILRERFELAEFSPLLFFLLASFISFILFFRFHVWLVLFSCAMLGLWAGQWKTSGGRWVRCACVALLALCWVIEARQPWFGPYRQETALVETPGAPKWNGPLFWGRPNVYADETEALMEHLRKFVAPEPVLANFGISASIAAYGGCPVVLHPKFESPEIRRRVQEYGEALFTGDETGFRSWMEAKGATVFVYSVGEFSEIQPGLQMRYMVDALTPPHEAAARLFEQRPEELQHFVPQFANRKFRVFRLKRSTVAARLAESLVVQARAALELGDLAQTETLGAHALRMDADNQEAQELVRHASVLRNAGFRTGENNDEEIWTPEASPLAPVRPWMEE